MKILLIGPSETKARGGMSEVIRGIRESELLGNEFEIDSFPSYIDGSLPVRLLYCFYAYFRFMVCYRKYDLFHIHTAERGSTFRKNFYLKKIKKAGKRAIIHIHGAEYLRFYDGLNRRRKRIVDRFFHRADLVLTLSDSWRRELLARFPIKMCRILYNGVDTVGLQEAYTEVEEHRHSFLMLGRLGRRKGALDLVNAVERAVLHNPALTVCMAGDGQVEKVRSFVREKGLEGHILIPGWIDGKEKMHYLRNASTIVLPSCDEGLPMSILEGMAAGKAIISTVVGGIPEAVTEENGILITPGDICALTEGLLRCSNDVEMLRDMSRKNREKAEDKFSIRQMHRQLAEYYRQMME